MPSGGVRVRNAARQGVSAAALLAVGAAVGYGLSDFLAGFYTRRVGLMPVLVIGQASGCLILAVLIVAVAPAELAFHDLAWGAAAGTVAVAGVWLLLQGFRVGRLSVVSPVSSVGAAGIPLLFDMTVGSRPSPLALVGICIGLAAIWLIGVTVPEPPGGAGSNGGLWYGLGAGAGFAAMYLLLDQSDPASGGWPVVAMLAAASMLATAAAVSARRPFLVQAADLPGLVATGVAGAVATLSFLLAARAGLVSIAALIASMSPAVTVLLARALLGELLPAGQVAGLSTAGAAVVLIGLG